MKKIIITFLAALLLFPLTTTAQYKLVINYADGSRKDTLVWDISSISFEPIAPKALPAGAVTPKSVDLGLSVAWADVNLGATTPTDAGWLIGWGDITALNTSNSLNWYPVLNPEADITNFGNDVIKSYWGAGDVAWRMPTDEEFQELIDQCTWTWDSEKNGFNVVAANGNSIFLPAGGSRDGKTVTPATLNYWSGTLNTTDKTTAKALTATSTSTKGAVSVLKRYLGCSLRAVSGAPKINVTVAAGETTEVGVSKATVTVTLGGSYQNYGTLRYGLIYGTQRDLNTDTGKKEVSVSYPTTGGSNAFALTNLLSDQVYYYISFVDVNGTRIYGQETKNFATTSFPVPEAVDLGLSVKWASFDVGAASASEIGKYMCWGDPTGMATKGANAGQLQTMNIGFHPEYDVATAKWGGKWRLPTRAEYEELYSKTTVKQVGNDFIFTGANGRSISMTFTGLITDGNTVTQTRWGWYWTAECSESGMPWIMAQYSTNAPYFTQLGSNSRAPIRAVYQEGTGYVSGGGGSGSEPSGGDTPTPSNPPVVVEESDDAGTAVDLGLSVKWADRNVGAANAAYHGYYYTWGATAPQESYTVSAYVWGEQSGPERMLNRMKYLGTLPEMNGSYKIQGTEYDAAHVNWKGTWMMPNEKQIFELINNCDWTWTSRTTDAGTFWGYEIRGKGSYVGNAIFLPAAGYMTQTGSAPAVFHDDTEGLYWSDEVRWGIDASLNNREPYVLLFNETQKNGSSYRERTIGLPIRPVQPK